jgi:hypothetical protein
VVISAFPNGSIDPLPEEDAPFWSRVEEIGIPVAVHIGSFFPQAVGGGAKTVDMQSLAFLGAAEPRRRAGIRSP